MRFWIRENQIRRGKMKFEHYFNENFASLQPEITPINTLLDDQMIMINGDFHGIQKFIFDGLSTKNASKILRAKSAFIQIFTDVLSKYICHKLGIDYRYIISANAGKFEILSPIIDYTLLDEIQKKVNTYFIDNFYGLSSVNICSTLCCKEEFLDTTLYRALRKRVSDSIELQKFNKLDLIDLKTPILKFDHHLDNQTLCKICNMRKITHQTCDICAVFLELGKLLTSDKTTISSKKLGIILDDFDTEIDLNDKIKSYLLKDEYNAPVLFENLVLLSEGIKALGVLKADVDGMGNFIKNSDITDSFENFDLFSKAIDAFFSLHIPKMMKEKFPNTYTVFAGGDDLFLIGAWDEILKLSRFIHDEFKRFVKIPLTISFGIIIAKENTPVNYLAEYSEHLLEASKSIDENKDAISIFDESVKWDSYLDVYEKINTALSEIEEINTAFLYRLLDFIGMSKAVKNGNIEATMWKSKLRYSFNRNLDPKYASLLEVFATLIETTPQECKIVLSEFIYKRRD